MKKLLSLVILVVGLVVISYAVSHHSHKKAPAPAPVVVQTPAEVIEQEHSEVLPPPAPEAPYVITPTDPKLAPVLIPTPKPRVVQKKKSHHVVKAPRPQQYVLPPPAHCICKA